MNTREQAIEILAKSGWGNAYVNERIIDTLIAANLIPSVSPATAWDEGHRFIAPFNGKHTVATREEVLSYPAGVTFVDSKGAPWSTGAEVEHWDDATKARHLEAMLTHLPFTTYYEDFNPYRSPAATKGNTDD